MSFDCTKFTCRNMHLNRDIGSRRTISSMKLSCKLRKPLKAAVCLVRLRKSNRPDKGLFRGLVSPKQLILLRFWFTSIAPSPSRAAPRHF